MLEKICGVCHADKLKKGVAGTKSVTEGLSDTTSKKIHSLKIRKGWLAGKTAKFTAEIDNLRKLWGAEGYEDQLLDLLVEVKLADFYRVAKELTRQYDQDKEESSK